MFKNLDKKHIGNMLTKLLCDGELKETATKDVVLIKKMNKNDTLKTLI